MIGTIGIWNLGLTMAIVLPIVFFLCFVTYLLHRDSQGEVVHLRISMPRLIPWSIASKARKTRAEVEWEKAKEDLFQQKHRTLQNQIVLTDLENEHYRRALEQSND